jgi:hypothetical protein
MMRIAEHILIAMAFAIMIATPMFVILAFIQQL